MNIKISSLFFTIAKAIEKNPKVPSIPEIETKFDAFLQAIEFEDLSKQTLIGNELIASLVKWQVEKV